MKHRVFPILVIGLVVAILPGCALFGGKSVSEKLGEKVSEGVLENITNTDVDLDSNESGKKSENWPTEIPSHDKGEEFTYSKWGGSYALSYYIPQSAGSLNEVSTTIWSDMENAGWISEGDFSLYESDDSAFRTYENTESSLIITVSIDEPTSRFMVSIISGPKNEETEE
jgi:hypothetical protein